MAVSQIAINNQFSAYQQSMGLDGLKYSFNFRYNKRNDTWYMELLGDANQVLLGPKPCLSNVIQHTGRIKAYAFPIGDIMFLDVAGSGLDCTFDNFGDAIGLFYQNVDPA